MEVKLMKVTGIIRRVDELGRVVIPKEIRRTFHVKEGDPLEIYVTGEGILFKPYDENKTYRDTLNEMIVEMQNDYKGYYNNNIEITNKLKEVIQLLEKTE
jgi:AbrB family looped-hinge helix DNA binding protein